MSEKHIYKDIREFIDRLGFKMISNEYINQFQLLVFQDREGYLYSQSFKILQRNQIQSFVSCNNIFSTDNIKLFMKKNNINLELISKYTNNNDKLILKDNNGYYYTQFWNNLRKLYKPSYADINNKYSIQNLKLWCKLNNKPFELISDGYIGNKEKLQWHCLIENCGEIFENNWANISQGQGCGYCCSKQIGLSNCLATKNPKLSFEWHPTLNGSLTSFDVLCGSHKEVWWKCKKCEYEWKASVGNRNAGRGCSECNESKGEKKIKEIYDFQDINYIPQKTFEGLLGLGGGLLSFDFYLPNHNLLVEYQGEFHDGTAWQQSEIDYDKQVEHDIRKRQYAKDHNINLLEIWYQDFNNIEKILKEELNL